MSARSAGRTAVSIHSTQIPGPILRIQYSLTLDQASAHTHPHTHILVHTCWLNKKMASSKVSFKSCWPGKSTFFFVNFHGEPFVSVWNCGFEQNSFVKEEEATFEVVADRNLKKNVRQGRRQLWIFRNFPFTHFTPLFPFIKLTSKPALLLQLIAVILAIAVTVTDKSNGYAFATSAVKLLFLAVVWQCGSCKKRANQMHIN